MTHVSALSQFNKGFLSGAGFSFGVGISNFLNNSLFGFGMSYNPFFFNPFMSFNMLNAFNLQSGFLAGYGLGMSGFKNQQASQFSGINSNVSVFGDTTAFCTGMDTFNSTSYMPLNFGESLFGGPFMVAPKINNDVVDKGNKDENSDKNYKNLSRADALKKAEKDENLEKLTGGEGWTISEKSFIHDIPYAKKGTGKLLAKACEQAGVSLTVTSALGTGETGSPHTATGEVSHYNEKNPKLDFGGYNSKDEADKVAEMLRGTELFSRVAVEPNKGGSGYHLDVQFSDDKYETV